MLFRKEIITTLDHSQFTKVLAILQKNEIPYDTKTVNLSGGNAFESQRGRSGSFGINTNCIRQYYIYVKKKEFERAKAALRCL